MSDIELKQLLNRYKLQYGASYAYIARRCGVTREHISRWMHNENYNLSESLKAKLFKILTIK